MKAQAEQVIITPGNLHKSRFSDVIESAIGDVKRAIAAGFKIDMAYFSHTNHVCSVCLGGAAVIGFLPYEGEALKELIRRSNITNLYQLTDLVSEKHTTELANMAKMFNTIRSGEILQTAYHAGEIWGKEYYTPVRELMTMWSVNYHRVTGLLDKKEIKYMLTQLKRLADMARAEGI